ncbi:MAG: DUF5916 domain-containing protein [Bacteroidota bacterium]
MHKRFLLWFLVFSPCGLLYPQDNNQPIIAVRVIEPPHVDGILTDEAWKLASSISTFTQRELEEGKPGSERTEVKIVYDDHALYIGFWGYDSDPSAINATEMKRDFNTDVEDDFGVVLDTYHDKRNAFWFFVNPNGARADALVTDEGQGLNADWNGLWDAQTVVTGEGWFAEIEIPFSTLRFLEGADQVWGINFVRNIKRKQEQALWRAFLRNHGLLKLSQAGTLTGLSNIHRGSAVEVKPYLLGGLEHVAEGQSTQTKVGLDVKYSLTPTLTLDLTTNTDFAQVEADRERINLSRFPLFFPEKRDFFLEGADVFNTQFGDAPRMFYSRRIGISSSRELQPILGGVRLVGKSGAYNIGMLTMQTAARGGEPLTNYAVARVKRDIADQSYVGFIATNKQSSLSYSRLLGADGAWVQSDILGTNTLIVGGAVAGTSDAVTTSNNLAYRMYADFPNDLIEHFIGVRSVQDNFDPQVGFLDRSNFRQYSWDFKIRPRPEGFGVQYFEFKPGEIEYFTNFDGSVQSMDYEARPLGFCTHSGETFELNFQRFADNPQEDIDFFGNPVIAATYWWTRWEVQLETNQGRPVSFAGNYSWGGFYNGQRQEYELASQLRVGGSLIMNLDYTRNSVQFATSDFLTNEAGASLSYGFSPLLNSSLLVQWNNEENEVNMNFRIHWIPEIGSDVFLVYNQLFDALGNLQPSRTTILLKVAYLFVL